MTNTIEAYQPVIPNDPVEIKDFRWEETSVVDFGANREVGWAVIKNLNITPEQYDGLSDVIKAELTVISQDQLLYDALADFNVNGVPKPVIKSVETLTTWLTEQGYTNIDKAKKKPAMDDPEDALDHGADEASEDANGKKKTPKPDAEDATDNGADEASEDANGKKKAPTARSGISMKDLLLEFIRTVAGVNKNAPVEVDITKVLSPHLPAFTQEIAHIYHSSADTKDRSTAITAAVQKLASNLE